MLEKTGTCKSCGYENAHCICQNKNQHGTVYNRNTSGARRIYQNYTDFQDRGFNDYAMTSRISRADSKQIKLMEELAPLDNETLEQFILRTEIAEQKLTEYSITHHLYGTRKGAWACHTSSRYCFICTMAQFINVHRALNASLREIQDLSKVTIHLTTIPNGSPEIHLTNSLPATHSS